MTRPSLEAAQYACHGCHRPLNIRIICSPIDDTHPHGSLAPPARTAEESFAGHVDGVDHGVGARVVIRVARVRPRVEEADQPLVQVWSPEHLDVRERSDARHERCRVRAGPVDEVLQPAPAQLSKGGVDHNPATSTGPLWIPVDLIAGTALGSNIGGTDGHGCSVRRAVAHEDQAAVEWYVQPLVPVGRPAIRRLNAGDVMALGAAGAREEAEGTVHMNPRAGRFGDRNQCREGVERGDIQVSGVQYHDRWRPAPLEFGLQSLRRDTALGIRRKSDEISSPEAQITHCTLDGAVSVFAGDDADPWRSV